MKFDRAVIFNIYFIKLKELFSSINIFSLKEKNKKQKIVKTYNIQ